MTVESVTYISDLDSTYPAEAEVGTLHEGNDHIRNIKSALTTTFPKIAAAVSASASELNVLDGIIATTAQLNAPILATLQAATSGTSIDFTSIPSWVKRITVMFQAVSTDGTSPLLLQIGDSGGLETTGYSCISTLTIDGTATGGDAGTTGFRIQAAGASNTITGAITLTLMNAATYLWVASGVLAPTNVAGTIQIAGYKALSATLDRLSVSTVGGTDVFDHGSINIMYE